MQYVIHFAEISGVHNIIGKMGMYEVLFNLPVNILQNVQKVILWTEQTVSS
jgi:hypothetical protein